MPILKTISLATLQTFTHLLTEMEREGLFNLAEARVTVARETELRHQLRRSRLTEKQAPLPFICPDCRRPMAVCYVTGTMYCSCGFSLLIGGDGV
jgi:hypothetical protein